MKVKAKWSVKDATGWHDAGEVFETESDLGNAVEVLEAEKARPVKEPEVTAEPGKEPEAEPVQETVVKPRSTTRRKASTTK